MCSYQCLNWIMGNDLTEVMLRRQLSGTRGKQNQFWIHISHGQKITRCPWRPPLGEISRGLKSRGVGKKGRWERRVCWVGWREDSESISTPHLLSSLLAAAANHVVTGLPWWLGGYRICLQFRRPGFNPCVRKIPWRRERQPTPIFLPGVSQGQRTLIGYSLWGHKSQPRLSD